MWQCVVLNASATKNLWGVSIQSSRWHQRREFCAIFVKQFDFGLTYKNEISSVRLGENLISSCTFSLWHFSGSPPPTLGKSVVFSKDNSRHSKNIPVHNCLVEVYVWAAATIYRDEVLASRQNWNLQPLKVRDTNSWVVPSTCFKFRNWDVRCTIHRNMPIQLHKQYWDPWEIERSIFNLEVSLKPT